MNPRDRDCGMFSCFPYSVQGRVPVYHGWRHPLALCGLLQGPLLYGVLVRMWRSYLIFSVAHNKKQPAIRELERGKATVPETVYQKADFAGRVLAACSI